MFLSTMFTKVHQEWNFLSFSTSTSVVLSNFNISAVTKDSDGGDICIVIWREELASPMLLYTCSKKRKLPQVEMDEKVA